MATDISPPPEEYLATGFAHVDARQHVQPFAACLRISRDSATHFAAIRPPISRPFGRAVGA